MKKTSFILSIIAVAGVIALAIVQLCGSKAGTKAQEPAEESIKAEIVYFQLDKVVSKYQRAIDDNASFEAEASKVSDEVAKREKSIREEIERRGNKLEADMKAWQEKVDKGLLTRSTAEAQAQTLQQRQAELQEYVQKRQDEFNQYAQKRQAELAEKQQVILNNIANDIKVFVDEFRAKSGYNMIISTQGELLPAPVAAADERLDVSDAIINGLNDSYKPAKK